MNAKRSSDVLFLKSALTPQGSFKTTEQVIDWISIQNFSVKVNVSPCSLYEMEGWDYDDSTGCIRHHSSKFFSIDGIDVKSNWGPFNHWQQPIINQPEIGFLGIIVKEFDGVLHFLLQAKFEPGNINHCQLSPTLQATKSNYTRMHNGQAPRYLDYFQNVHQDQILLDQLQSEQGGRFLRKRNRNIIIKIDEEIPEHNDFIWLTLSQIKNLMQVNNLVNMDCRSVISGIPLGDHPPESIEIFNALLFKNNPDDHKLSFLKSALTHGVARHTTEEIIAFITNIKSMTDLNIERVPLKNLNGWIFNEMEIRHVEERYFKVIGVDVEIENREVIHWSQPMVQPAQEGLCAFVAKEINGLFHFIVQAKFECGNHDLIEFAPTVQCLTGNYRETKTDRLPFLNTVLSARPEQIFYDAMQSEEGGRFYQEQNRNMIVLLDDTFPEELPPHYIWMTLNQLYEFLKFNNYLNIQSRSLIAAIPYI